MFAAFQGAPVPSPAQQDDAGNADHAAVMGSAAGEVAMEAEAAAGPPGSQLPPAAAPLPAQRSSGRPSNGLQPAAGLVPDTRSVHMRLLHPALEVRMPRRVVHALLPHHFPRQPLPAEADPVSAVGVMGAGGAQHSVAAVAAEGAGAQLPRRFTILLDVDVDGVRQGPTRPTQLTWYSSSQYGSCGRVLSREFAGKIICGWVVLVEGSARGERHVALHLATPTDEELAQLAAPASDIRTVSLKGRSLRALMHRMSSEVAASLLGRVPAAGDRLQLSFVPAPGSEQDGSVVQNIPRQPVTVQLQQLLSELRPMFVLKGHTIPAATLKAVQLTGACRQVGYPAFGGGQPPIPHWELEFRVKEVSMVAGSNTGRMRGSAAAGGMPTVQGAEGEEGGVEGASEEVDDGMEVDGGAEGAAQQAHSEPLPAAAAVKLEQPPLPDSTVPKLGGDPSPHPLARTKLPAALQRTPSSMAANSGPPDSQQAGPSVQVIAAPAAQPGTAVAAAGTAGAHGCKRAAAAADECAEDADSKRPRPSSKTFEQPVLRRAQLVHPPNSRLLSQAQLPAQSQPQAQVKPEPESEPQDQSDAPSQRLSQPPSQQQAQSPSAQQAPAQVPSQQQALPPSQSQLPAQPQAQEQLSSQQQDLPPTQSQLPAQPPSQPPPAGHPHIETAAQQPPNAPDSQHPEAGNQAPAAVPAAAVLMTTAAAAAARSAAAAAARAALPAAGPAAAAGPDPQPSLPDAGEAQAVWDAVSAAYKAWVAAVKRGGDAALDVFDAKGEFLDRLRDTCRALLLANCSMERAAVTDALGPLFDLDIPDALLIRFYHNRLARVREHALAGDVGRAAEVLVQGLGGLPAGAGGL